MRKTFVCDESMVITIPIGSLRDAREGQLMPETFQCVYRDSYKVFAVKGRPKPLGAAQAISGVFIVTLGLIFTQTENFIRLYTIPSVLGTVYLCICSYFLLTVLQFPCNGFVVCGMLSYAAGQYPNMHVTKLSFSINIVSFFWSVGAVCLCGITFHLNLLEVHLGINGLIMSLLVLEMLITLSLIYWLSKAVCRQHFNTLPIILLKQGD